MATHKQTEANRRNAQQSTGPRTGNGKARAAMNNLKHGIYAESEIIPGEDVSQRQALEEVLSHGEPPVKRRNTKSAIEASAAPTAALNLVTMGGGVLFGKNRPIQ